MSDHQHDDRHRFSRQHSTGMLDLERAIAELPPRIRSLEPCGEPYPVAVSAELRAYQRRVREAVAGSVPG